jgi:hypothetical protein
MRPGKKLRGLQKTAKLIERPPGAEDAVDPLDEDEKQEAARRRLHTVSILFVSILVLSPLIKRRAHILADSARVVTVPIGT